MNSRFSRHSSAYVHIVKQGLLARPRGRATAMPDVSIQHSPYGRGQVSSV